MYRIFWDATQEDWKPISNLRITFEKNIFKTETIPKQNSI